MIRYVAIVLVSFLINQIKPSFFSITTLKTILISTLLAYIMVLHNEKIWPRYMELFVTPTVTCLYQDWTRALSALFIIRLYFYLCWIKDLLEYHGNSRPWEVSFYQEILLAGVGLLVLGLVRNRSPTLFLKKKKKKIRRIQWFRQVLCWVLTFCLLVSTVLLWTLPDDGPFARPQHESRGWISCTYKQSQPDHSRQCSAPLCYYSTATKMLSLCFLIITAHAFFVTQFCKTFLQEHVEFTLWQDTMYCIMSFFHAYVLLACKSNIRGEWIVFLVTGAGVGFFASDIERLLYTWTPLSVVIKQQIARNEGTTFATK